MSKKKFFILGPHVDKPDAAEQLKEKAMAYYGSKDHEQVEVTPELSEAFNKMAEAYSEKKCNLDLLMTGISVVGLSEADSVYVLKGWEEDDRCKLCHMLAFSHGLDLVYEE